MADNTQPVSFFRTDSAALSMPEKPPTAALQLPGLFVQPAPYVPLMARMEPSDSACVVRSTRLTFEFTSSWGSQPLAPIIHSSAPVSRVEVVRVGIFLLKVVMGVLLLGRYKLSYWERSDTVPV